MKIIEKLKKRTKNLNQPIELMNFKELNEELIKNLKNINSIDFIDDRSNQIIEFFLEMPTREKYAKEIFLVDVFSRLKSTELKNELLNRYSKYIDEENIEKFCQSIERAEIRGVQGNKKAIPNRNIKKEEEVDKKSNNEDRERHLKNLKTFIGIIYSQNLEKINLMEVIENVEYETFEKVYEKIPENQKYSFIIETLKINILLQNDERFKNLIANIPLHNIKEELLKSDFDSTKHIRDCLEENIQISGDDVRDFYRKNGTLNDEGLNVLGSEEKKYSSDELLEELKYFIDIKNKKDFLFTIFFGKRSDIEEGKKIILDKSIEKEIRILVLQCISNKLTYKERLSIFYDVEEEIRSMAVDCFTSVKFINKKEEDIEEEEYANKILEKITDNRIYDNYAISFFRRLDIEPNIIFMILKNSPKYLDDLEIYDILLKLTDGQIKELYEKASDEAKVRMICLSRKKTIWDETILGENEVEKYNKDIPQYLLVNENSYYELIKDAGPKTLRKLMSMEEFSNLLTKEQKIEYLRKIVNKTERSEIYECLKSLMPILNVDDIKSELLKISEIKDKFLQIEYAKFLIEKYMSLDNKDYLTRIDNNAIRQAATDISNMLEDLIRDSKTTIEDKYLYVSLYFQIYGRYYRMSVKEEEEKKIKSFDLFKYVNKLAKKEKYNDFLNTDGFLYRGDLIPYFYDEKVFKTFTKLYENNHEVINTIIATLLEQEILNTIDYNLLEFYSRYSNMNGLANVLKDEIKSKIFIEIYNRLNNLKAYPEEELLKIINSLERTRKEELEKIDLTDEHYVDTVIAICQDPNCNRIVTEMVNSYEKEIKNKTRETVNKPFVSRIQLLDAIGKRFFYCSYKEMKDLVRKYGKDAKLFIKKYESKEVLNEEEENELTALRIIRNISEILNIKDKKAIIDTFNELDKDELFENIDFLAKIALDENVRRVFAKDYLKDLYIPRESDKKIIDGIEVYSPKEFNMFVNVIGAYSNYKLIDNNKPKKSAVEAWKNIENNQRHMVCTSYIRNTNISYVRKVKPKKKIFDRVMKKINMEKKNQDIIVGFANIGVNSIQMSSTADIATVTDQIESQKAFRNYTFRSADNLSNGTRIMYNEVDIEERLEDDKSKNLDFSYVVCFDNITEDSKKIKKDFGTDIVYIDNNEIAKQESERLDETFNQYRKSKDPKLLKDIITQYMNNGISFSFTRRDLMDKYFNEEKMTKRINAIISDLEKQYKLGNKLKAIEGISILYNSFNDEIEKYLYGGVDPALSNCSNFNIKYFAFDLKNRMKSLGIDINRKNNNNYENTPMVSRSIQDVMMQKIKQIQLDTLEK